MNYWLQLSSEQRFITGELCLLMELQPVDLVFNGLRKGKEVPGLKAIGTECLQYLPQHELGVSVPVREWGVFGRVNRSMCRRLAIMALVHNASGKFRERFANLFGDDPTEVPDDCQGFNKLRGKPNGEESIRIRKELFESATTYEHIWNLSS